MSWQKMSKHVPEYVQGARWKNIPEDQALRIFECRFHNPKQMLRDLMNSPGRIAETMHAKVRFVENR